MDVVVTATAKVPLRPVHFSSTWLRVGCSKVKAGCSPASSGRVYADSALSHAPVCLHDMVLRFWANFTFYLSSVCTFLL
jgi:hypothetical protein